MPKVTQVSLQPGEHPAEACDWILIERAPSGRFDIIRCEQDGDHVHFIYDRGLFSLTSAIEHALPAAYRLGISKIYIQLDAESTWPRD